MTHRIYYLLIILFIKYQKSPGPLIKLSSINKFFRRHPEEICPRHSEDHTPSKPLSGIELLMESHTTSLLVLPQSKLVKNTTKYIQSKLDTDKLGQDWNYPQQIVKSLAPLRYYKSKPEYFPTQTIPPLDSDVLQIDISNGGKYSSQNMKIWESSGN